MDPDMCSPPQTESVYKITAYVEDTLAPINKYGLRTYKLRKEMEIQCRHEITVYVSAHNPAHAEHCFKGLFSKDVVSKMEITAEIT